MKQFALLFLIFCFPYIIAFSDKGKGALEVNPNPGSGLFNVYYKSDVKGDLQLIVCDATGKYVYLKSRRDFSGELKELVDLSTLPKGVYVFQVELAQELVSTKVILQ
jgi:hypothetical protein